MLLATVVNASSQTRVADQLLRMLKAGNIADGCQNGHREHHAEARDLHQEDHLRGPRLAIAQAGQFLMNCFFVRTEMLQDDQVLFDLKTDHAGKFLLLPPRTVLFAEQLALGRNQIETMDEAL